MANTIKHKHVIYQNPCLGSQKLRILEAYNLEILESHNLRISESQNLRILESQNLRISESQNLRFIESQNHTIVDYQNLTIFESQTAQWVSPRTRIWADPGSIPGPMPSTNKMFLGTVASISTDTGSLWRCFQSPFGEDSSEGPNMTFSRNVWDDFSNVPGAPGSILNPLPGQKHKQTTQNRKHKKQHISLYTCI